VHLFLTGATGSVGLEVLRALRDDARFSRVTCLLRGNHKDTASARWSRLLDQHDLRKPSSAPGPVLDMLDGDLLTPNFAVAPTTLRAITATVTHVLHSAAHIRFDAPYEEAHAINVQGTQRMIEVTRQCPMLKTFGYVSTLYVVGTRQGKLPENAAPEGEFNNAYEQTKYEAEQLVRSCGLPADIYRLALLQGRAADGYVHHFLESHMLMDAFCRGACASIPGTAQARLDMLPTDYTATVLVKLLSEHAASGHIWSIAAGDDAPTIAQLYELIRQQMVARGLPEPVQPNYIDHDTLQAILQSDDPRAHGLSPGACAILEVVGAYLLRPKIYTSSTVAGMPPAPPPSTWMLPVLNYCLNTGWGRRV